jgi:hypothetical protein
MGYCHLDDLRLLFASQNGEIASGNRGNDMLDEPNPRARSENEMRPVWYSLIGENVMQGKISAIVTAVLLFASASLAASKETVLYSFTGGSQGSAPYYLIKGPAGSFYGLAQTPSGIGCVFELAPSNGGWTESVLYNFQGGNDGGNPNDIFLDANGDIFGTNGNGGSAGEGTVFELFPPAMPGGAWTESVLYTFCSLTNCDDGGGPLGVTPDGLGNLYGATSGGGGGLNGGEGSVFELTPSNGSWAETVIYNFGQRGSPGQNPASGVTIDTEGNLYGTLFYGGDGCEIGRFGSSTGGLVYEVSPSNGAWVASDIFGFPAIRGTNLPCPEGSGLWRDPSGNLYGTISDTSCNNNPEHGCGSVYELSLSNGMWALTKEDLIHYGPYVITYDSTTGNLYGPGGSKTGWAVYELKHSTGFRWKETALYDFGNSGNGLGRVVIDGGSLVGTSAGGGANGLGFVYELTK